MTSTDGRAADRVTRTDGRAAVRVTSTDGRAAVRVTRTDGTCIECWPLCCTCVEGSLAVLDVCRWLACRAVRVSRARLPCCRLGRLGTKRLLLRAERPANL